MQKSLDFEMSQIIFHWEPEELCHCVATHSILYFQGNRIFSGYGVCMYRILSCWSTLSPKFQAQEVGDPVLWSMNFIVSGVVEEGIIKKAASGVFMFVTTWGISLLLLATDTASAVADNNVMLITAKNSFCFIFIWSRIFIILPAPAIWWFLD